MFIIDMIKLNWIIGFILFLNVGYSANDKVIEPWIDTNDLYEIKIDMTIEDVIKRLGDPVFIESSYDDEVIITTYNYNFRTKAYDTKIIEDNPSQLSDFSHTWGRTTNIQFAFVDEKLIGWEEDKLTLAMAETEQKNNSRLNYVSLLLNLILIVKVF